MPKSKPDDRGDLIPPPYPIVLYPQTFQVQTDIILRTESQCVLTVSYSPLLTRIVSYWCFYFSTNLIF